MRWKGWILGLLKDQERAQELEFNYAFYTLSPNHKTIKYRQ